MHDTIEVRYKFFKVRSSNESSTTNIIDVLNRLLLQCDSNGKTFDIDNKTYLIKNKCHKDVKGNMAWLFTNIRMNNMPTVVNSSGDSKSLELEDDEGLGENCAMACDPTGSVVAIQSNRYAMTESGIAKIVNQGLSGEQIFFDPILNTNIFNEFDRISQLRSLHIRIANSENLSIFKETTDLMSDEDKIMFQKALQAPYLDISWSVGRHNMSLGDRFKSMLKFFHNAKDTDEGRNTIKKFDAKIQIEENGEYTTSLIDFLSDRIYFSADVLVNKHREIDEDSLLKVGCSALVECADELDGYIKIN